MALQTLNTIKQWFKTGLKPTQAQFWDTWDSFRHKFEKIPVKDIDGIDELLLSKADKTVLDNHLADKSAHAPQVNTDWNSESGFSQLLNKPEFRTVNGQTIVGTGDIAITTESADLQSVLDNGSYAKLENKTVQIYNHGANPLDYSQSTSHPNFIQITNMKNHNSGRFEVGRGFANIVQSTAEGNTTTVEFENNFSETGNKVNIKFPSKPTGDYTLSTTSDFKTINGESIIGEGNLDIEPQGLKSVLDADPTASYGESKATLMGDYGTSKFNEIIVSDETEKTGIYQLKNQLSFDHTVLDSNDIGNITLSEGNVILTRDKSNNQTVVDISDPVANTQLRFPAKSEEGKTYTIATTDDFKTINGESIVGSGDILINGGGGNIPTLQEVLDKDRNATNASINLLSEDGESQTTVHDGGLNISEKTETGFLITDINKLGVSVSKDEETTFVNVLADELSLNKNLSGNPVKQGIVLNQESSGASTIKLPLTSDGDVKTLATTEDFKTINGESIVGEGDITIEGGTTPDATSAVKGIVKLTGDLGGTADNPTTPTAIHITGNESFTGVKSSINTGVTPNGQNGGFELTNDSADYSVLKITNNKGKSVYISNEAEFCQGIRIKNAFGDSQGIDIENIGTGTGLNLSNISTGNALVLSNSSTGNGFYLFNTQSGNGQLVENLAYGNGVRINNPSGGTGAYIINQELGSGLGIDNSGLGVGFVISNIGKGTGQRLQNNGTGTGITLYNAGSGRAINIDNINSGDALNINQSGSGTGIAIIKGDDAQNAGIFIGQQVGIGIQILNVKSFSQGIHITNNQVNSQGIDVTNGGKGTGFRIHNGSTGRGIDINNSDGGRGIFLSNGSGAGFNIGLEAVNYGDNVAISVQNNGIGYGYDTDNNSTGIGHNIRNNSSGTGLNIYNSESGKGINLYNGKSGSGISLINELHGLGIDLNNRGIGYGQRIDNINNGYGLFLINRGTNYGQIIQNLSTGKGLRIESSGNGYALDIFEEGNNRAINILKSNTSVATAINIEQRAGLGIDIKNELGSDGGLRIVNNSSQYGILISNATTGQGINLYNAVSGKGIILTNAGIGEGIFIQNDTSGIGQKIFNKSTGTGQDVTNTGNGIGYRLINSVAGIGFSVSNQDTGTAMDFDENGNGTTIKIRKNTTSEATAISIRQTLGNGIDITNLSTGSGIFINNIDSGRGVRITNYLAGIGADITNNGIGNGLEIGNGSTGKAINIGNSGSGKGVSVENRSSGQGIVVNGQVGATGFNFVGKNNSVDTFTVDKTGNVTSNGTIATKGVVSSYIANNALIVYNSMSNNSSMNTFGDSENVDGNTGFYSLESLKYNDTDGIQKITYINGTNVGKMYIRVKNAGTWTAWVEK